MLPERLDLTVRAVKPDGRNNLRFELAAEGGGPLPAFTAGAHVDIHMADGLIRQYSLCGVPGVSETYEICVSSILAAILTLLSRTRMRR